MSNYWKKKLDELNAENEKKSSENNTPPADYWGVQQKELEESERKKNDIAPVREPTTESVLLGSNDDFPIGGAGAGGGANKGGFGNVSNSNLSSAERGANRNNAVIEYNYERLAKTQMDGTNHSILEELDAISKMESGKDKKKRKEAVIKKMETLGIPASDYALYTEDSNFSLGGFFDWLGDAAMTGLSGFNSAITATADVILGKPLQSLGWENNPISKSAKYFKDTNEAYQYDTNLSAEKLGGGKGYDIGGQFVTGLTGALPNAMLALMTAGASTATTTLPQAATAGAGILSKIGVTVQSMASNPHFWLSFAQTYGNDYNEAIEGGASDTVAALGAMTTSLLNAGIEVGVNGGSGIQGLPDELLKGDKPAVFNWIKSSLEEGNEELLQGVIERLVDKATYAPETTVLDGNQMLNDFLMGTGVGAALGGGQVGLNVATNTVANSIQQARANVLTDNEKTVVNKVYEDAVAEAEKDGKKLTNSEKKKLHDEVVETLKKGGISVETIEDVLRSDFTPTEGYEVTATSMTEDDRYLWESYRERDRKKVAFDADLSKYDAKQRATIQRAIDSGILNNTNRSHEFVDMVAKISAEKGVKFDFTDNEKLKNSGFAIEGKTVNGFVTKDGVTLNIDSSKSLNSVVGHEIAHVLEGTELYTELQSSIFEYAKSKGDFDGRLTSLSELYKDIEDADINAELTADLVGDYLFTDSDFINNLSTKHRNVFQKLYDEIKYLCKVATAGSKEAKELEKVKHAFEVAYRESSNATDNTKYSISAEQQQEYTERARTAAEKLGTTTDFNRAGFVTEDGKMLNLTKTQFGGVYHSGIEAVYDDTTGREAVNRFIQEGNARMIPGAPGIEIGTQKELSVSQLNVLSRFAAERLRNRGFFYLDITDPNGKHVASVTYEDGNTASDIIYDIKEYYQNGTIPKPSVQYSLSEDSNGNQLSPEAQKRYGNYNVYGEDVKLNAPTQQSENIPTNFVGGIDNEQNLVYNGKRGDTYARTDEFRRLQAESQGMPDEDIQLYRSGNKQVDEGIRANLARVFRTEIDSFRNGLRNDDGVLKLTAKGNEYNIVESVDGSLFHDVFEIARKYLRNGELVDLHEVETTEDGVGYNDCYNYLSEDGLCGFSITPDGDLISVFNASGKGGFLYAVAPIVKERAKTLDCYNSPNQPLVGMYQKVFGFKAAAVMDYNMEYDHDNIAENHSMPKVAFMVNTESDVETRAFTKDEYDEAVAYRNSFLNQATQNEVASFMPENAIAPTPSVTEETNTMENGVAETVDEFAPITEEEAQKYEAIRPPKQSTEPRMTEAEPRMKRVDSTNKAPDGKEERSWVRTSTGSEAVDGIITPDDIPDDARYYEVKSNKEALETANARLARDGYAKSREYFEGRMTDRKLTVEDIALGERLIQEAAKAGDSQAVRDLIIDVSIIGTELGQRVQALSMIRRLTPEGQLKALIRTVERGKAKGDKAFDGVEVDEEMIKRITETIKKDGTFEQAELDAAVEDVKQMIADKMSVSILDKVNAWRYLSMLGNPKTHLRNIVSNVAMLGTRTVKNVIARTAEDIFLHNSKPTLNTAPPATEVSKPTAQSAMPSGTRVRATDRGNIGTIRSYNAQTGKYTVYFENENGANATVQLDADLLVPLRPIGTAKNGKTADTADNGDIAPVHARTKTWKPATEAVKAFAKTTTAEMLPTIKGDNKYSDEGSIKAKREIFKSKILAPVNVSSDFNAKTLDAEDIIFSKPAFRATLQEYLTANGIKTEQDIKNNPQLIAKAKDYALEEARKATFRQDSYIANKISEIERRNPVYGLAVGSIMPFKKTPINIAKTGAAYSPLGIARGIYDFVQVGRGKADASEAIDHLAQGLTGTGLAVLGYALAEMGVLNGAGDDDKEGKYDYQLGEQSYSFNFGGDTYSLSWLSPVAMPLFVGANAYEIFVEKNEWNANVVIDTLGQTLDPMSEMSFISSLDDVLSSYDSGIAKIWGAGEAMVQNYATQFAPTLLSQIAATADDTKRSTKPSGDSGFTFGEETLNKFKYKIPGLRNTLEPTTDIWGNESKQTKNILARGFESFLSPANKREGIATAVDDELKALYREVGEAEILPAIPYNYIDYEGSKYDLSAKDFTEYKQTYGQTAYDLMESLFNTKMYKNATSEEKADMVADVYDYARDAAKKEYFTKYGVNFTNSTSENKKVFKENPIKAAIAADLPVDEYVFKTENPEKYDFFKSNGISYNDYKNADEDGKRAYSWAYDNPKKYIASKAITSDLFEYRKLTGELYDIKADKDKNGKTISGSRKDKVLDYINGLDLENGEKIILFKSEYNADDTYNYEIIDYLNNRDDISYSDMVTILEELGFTVDAKGNITWD